jgi:hypothetical protein
MTIMIYKFLHICVKTMYVRKTDPGGGGVGKEEFFFSKIFIYTSWE